jgi:hypothetical protein
MSFKWRNVLCWFFFFPLLMVIIKDIKRINGNICLYILVKSVTLSVCFLNQKYEKIFNEHDIKEWVTPVDSIGCILLENE